MLPLDLDYAHVKKNCKSAIRALLQPYSQSSYHGKSVSSQNSDQNKHSHKQLRRHLQKYSGLLQNINLFILFPQCLQAPRSFYDKTFLGSQDIAANKKDAKDWYFALQPACFLLLFLIKRNFNQMEGYITHCLLCSNEKEQHLRYCAASDIKAPSSVYFNWSLLGRKSGLKTVPCIRMLHSFYL